jgi:hypothetical protein
MRVSDRVKCELELAGLFDADSDYNGEVGKAVMELMDVFTNQGHSGFSAMLVADLFHRLVKGEILTPLTGKSNEWMEVADNLYQNKRRFSVFATDKNGTDAYDIDGIVFVDKDGCSFTSPKTGSLPVQFPYIQKDKIYIHYGTPEAEKYPEVFGDEEENVVANEPCKPYSKLYLVEDDE